MLNSFFEPDSVAVIGASRTPGKVGHDIVKNLLDAGFVGDIYPVNPKTDEILDLPCYADVTEVPGKVDLGLIVIPAPYVPDVLDQCAEKDIPAVIIITAGFKETGEEGAKLEREVARKCADHGIRCIGPNCLGVISTHQRLNATFAPVMPEPGNIGFFSQSGAMGTAILDVAVGEGFGLSRFVSYGNKADVDETDIIQALGEDDATDVILGYVESIADGQKFMDVAAQVTRKKPVVVFKSGRTSAGARAASSHTGSLAGSDSAYEAAFKQCGVIRAETVTEFFDYARALSTQPPPSGNRIAIVTNAGGPGIIATDAVGRSGMEMADLSEETVGLLTEKLPEQASLRNPVDVLGDARADRYRDAIRAVCADEGVDAVLTVLTPQTSTEPVKTAQAIGEAADRTDKPVLASFMGSASVGKGWDELDARDVPNLEHPDRAVWTLDAMYDYGQWLHTRPEEPPGYEFDDRAIEGAIEDALDAGRETLGERQARSIAAACGIPLPQSNFAADAEEAVAAAAEIGYPVVLKISSEDILHKSDAGGVKVGIEDEQALRDAYQEIMESAVAYDPEADLEGVLVQEMARKGREVIVGVNRDPQFGPVIMFGLGGIYVEVLKDVVFRVAPLTMRAAREMIEGIRTAQILHEFRGEPECDLDALAETLVRVSQLAVDYPRIAECDLNPLFVYPRGEGVTALDERFGLE